MAILKPRAYTALEGTAVATVPICDALFSFSLSLSLTHHGRHQRFFVALTMNIGSFTPSPFGVISKALGSSSPPAK